MMTTKRNTIAMVLMSLLALAVILYFATGAYRSHQHNLGHHEHAEHDMPFSYPDDAPAPTVALDVALDAVSGWNLFIATENFVFTPENINTDSVIGEGHAHLYVDGRKARIYAPWVHIPELGPGIHTLRVTLNTNSHQEILVDGGTVQAEMTIQSH